MKRINFPLVSGGLIILLIFIVMLFPKLFASTSPYGIQYLDTGIDNQGRLEIFTPPFPPSDAAPLGTDILGRDLLSLIVYGTRLTIGLGMLIVLGRFLIALPLGIAAGFGSMFSIALLRQFSVIFSAIPALLFSVIVLKLEFFLNLPKEASFLAFAAVLIGVGWPKLGLLVLERVEGILKRSFIKGQIAIGKNNMQIAWRNVLPHLAPELIILFFMEIARALALIMQLGIFGVFVGNLRLMEETERGLSQIMNISFEPEWASLLATSRSLIRTAPWVVIFPALAFFICILGFNLFGEGLREILQQREGRLLPSKQQIVAFIQRKAIVITILLVLVSSGLGYYVSYNNKTAFTSVGNQAEQLLTANEAIIGTPEAAELAARIATKLASMGLQPVGGKNYVKEYDFVKLYGCAASNLALLGDGNTTFSPSRDYSFYSFGNYDLSALIYDARTEDLFRLDNRDKFKNKFVLIETSHYSLSAVKVFIESIMGETEAKGVLCSLPKDEVLPPSIGSIVYPGPVLWVSANTADKLAGVPDLMVNIKLRSSDLPNSGRNIMGMLPGHDPKLGKEAIIIGFSYNYFAPDKSVAAANLNFALEMIRKAAEAKEQKRTLIFAFWDGHYTDEYHGIRSYAEQPVFPESDSVLYIDLTNLKSTSFNNLRYTSEQAPVTRYFAWSLGHQFTINCKKAGISLQSYTKQRQAAKVIYLGSRVGEVMFYELGIPTIEPAVKQGEIVLPGNHTLDDLGRVLLRTIRDSN